VPAAEPCPLVLPLIALLRELGQLLEGMSDAQYTQKPVGLVASSIGGHVRHSLDHMDALLRACATGSLDYDRRDCSTDVETRREAALGSLRRQEYELLRLPIEIDARPLRLSALLSAAGPAFGVDTSVGRELAFVLSHTVHHNSLMAVMVKTLGLPLPERFGYAPSTIAHLERRQCVR
jgi:uncharacterized damage-inducible protein DinB